MIAALVGWLAAFVLLGLGNTVGYHRLFTHRAFRAKAPLRVALGLLGASHSGPPLLWIGLHRHHHHRSDTPEDPHSPRGKGIWYAHTGWIVERMLLVPAHPVVSALFALSGFGQELAILVHDLRRLRGTNPPVWLELCPDLREDAALVWLERPLVTPALFVAQLATAWVVGGPAGIGWLWALHLALTNTSWAVNSVCHTRAFGRAPHDAGDDSRDVPWLALATLGESWHNTHHRFPRSARHGLGGGLDFSWVVIRALVAVGLASEPWLPKAARDR